MKDVCLIEELAKQRHPCWYRAGGFGEGTETAVPELQCSAGPSHLLWKVGVGRELNSSAWENDHRLWGLWVSALMQGTIKLRTTPLLPCRAMGIWWGRVSLSQGTGVGTVTTLLISQSRWGSLEKYLLPYGNGQWSVSYRPVQREYLCLLCVLWT